MLMVSAVTKVAQRDITKFLCFWRTVYMTHLRIRVSWFTAMIRLRINRTRAFAALQPCFSIFLRRPFALPFTYPTVFLASVALTRPVPFSQEENVRTQPPAHKVRQPLVAIFAHPPPPTVLFVLPYRRLLIGGRIISVRSAFGSVARLASTE